MSDGSLGKSVSEPEPAEFGSEKSSAAESRPLGGVQVAEVLERFGVPFLFTLCGGHISPILVEAERHGVRVIDVRDERNAVFAADAVARLTGIPGVAAVTAGPGLTNSITAVKNAQMAESPVVILGGATATVLKGRGSLQDIDQLALMAPHVKWQTSVSRVRDLAPAVEEAMWRSAHGVPGPVFVECPVDLLYGEETVARLFASSIKGSSLSARATRGYLAWHRRRLFAGVDPQRNGLCELPRMAKASTRQLQAVARKVRKAQRPVLLIGSGAMAEAEHAHDLAAAVRTLGVPSYCSGMARGLLGPADLRLFRHRRSEALKRADLVILAGVVCDFRLNYGRQIAAKATLVSIHRSAETGRKNRSPQILIEADPGRTVCDLSQQVQWPGATGEGNAWVDVLRERESEREQQIDQQASETTNETANETTGSAGITPLALFRALDPLLDLDSVVVADGGDFVGTASYTLRPRGPLSWLDPGAFGTLGVGGGFSLGAKLVRPESEVWLIWGDGSSAFSLSEFDSYRRHGLGVIAVVGNDASWAQIAREQVEILGDDLATALRHTDYHRVAEGYGGRGLAVNTLEELVPALLQAKAWAAQGEAVLVNVRLAASDFRKGSISL